GYNSWIIKKTRILLPCTHFQHLHVIFDLTFTCSDFTTSYLALDDEGQEIYLSMLSDWDMDAAIQSAADPCLNLKVDTKPFEEGLDDWDIIAPVDVPQHRIYNLMDKNSLLGSLTGTISSGVGKTFSSMQRAMGFKGEDDSKYKPSKQPMTDHEFRNYMDSSGHMVKPEEFRLSIYQGGIEPSLRRVTWRHLLNLFPHGMSGRERFDYMKNKEQEYYKLRDQWQRYVKNGNLSEEIKYVTTMVKKDVLRTDRTHKFYSGADDNKNLLALFNMLVTYALTHPEISYCQGMSDIASPLLVIQKDEAQAYLCLCGLMKRLRGNFHYNGDTITQKFKHLSDLLRIYDPDLFTYLQDINAHDLFFCYRWLLLELKREFPFDDSLYMLEVMWSTLPPDPPETELKLTDEEYVPDLLSNSPCSPSFTMKQTIYAKLIAMRRSRSTTRALPKDIGRDSSSSKENEIASESANNNSRIDVIENQNESNDEDLRLSQEYPPLETEETRSSIARSCSIDKTLELTLHAENVDHMNSILENAPRCEQDNDNASSKPKSQNSENSLKECDSDDRIVDSEKFHEDADPGSFGRGDETCDKSEEEEKHSENHANEMGSGDTKQDNLAGEEEKEETFEESTELTNDTDENAEVEDIYIDDDDSGQSQFYISLESSEETKTPVKQEQQFKGFFKNVKKMLSSPTHQARFNGNARQQVVKNNEKENNSMVLKGKEQNTSLSQTKQTNMDGVQDSSPKR
ncbi:hypothetical protein FSP39_021297, partial [Pinctada imbricata]